MVLSLKNLPVEAIPGFHIIREIGRGNNGAVFLARQVALDRLVALKILLPELTNEDPTYIHNFLHEARIAAKLDHPHIVQALDAGETPTGYYFFAMEFVDGMSLEDIRQKQPERISLQFLLEVLIQLADAMDYAWQSHRMIHGDIKPGNLLIRSSDNSVKLADLGLARVSGATGNDEIMATPMYAAPEVIRGQHELIDPRTDIYCFGVMFYELAAGTAPFHGNTEEMLRQHLEVKPIPLIQSNPDIDPEISAFVDKMLEKDPAFRPANWLEVKKFLETILEKQLEHSRMTKQNLQTKKTKSKPSDRTSESFYDYCMQRPLLLGLLATFITIILVGLGFIAYSLNHVTSIPSTHTAIVKPPPEPPTPPVTPELTNPKIQVAISSPALEKPPREPKPELTPPPATLENSPETTPTTEPPESTLAEPVAEPPAEQVQPDPTPAVEKPAPTPQPKLLPGGSAPYNEVRANQLASQIIKQINRLGNNFSKTWKAQAIMHVYSTAVVLAQLEYAGFPCKELTRFDVLSSGRSASWHSFNNSGVIQLSPKSQPECIARELGVGFYEKLRERRIAPPGMSNEFGDAIAFFVEKRSGSTNFINNPIVIRSGGTLEGFIQLLKSRNFNFHKTSTPNRRKP